MAFISKTFNESQEFSCSFKRKGPFPFSSARFFKFVLEAKMKAWFFTFHVFVLGRSKFGGCHGLRSDGMAT